MTERGDFCDYGKWEIIVAKKKKVIPLKYKQWGWQVVGGAQLIWKITVDVFGDYSAYRKCG